jgi:hypothetical protein
LLTSNAVSGTTTGALTLEQDVYAGDAGGSNGGAGGTAGTATSNFSLTQNSVANLTAYSIATGGSGGSSQNASASGGGGATATITLASNTSGTVNANAGANYYGGGSGYSYGGNVTSGAGTGGSGSSGSATSSSIENGTGISNANAFSAGGNGGNAANAGFSGGSGGNANSSATAVSTTGPATAMAVATGGSGGTDSAGSAGTAGTASTTAVNHGITVTDFVPFAGNSHLGGEAASQVNWTSSAGATIIVGPSGNNIGSGVVTGTLAHMNAIAGTGTLTVGDGTNHTLLQLNANIGGSSQGSLIIKPNSTLDLNNDHFFINYGAAADPIASIAAYIKSGFNGGLWNGLGIDTSAGALQDSVSSNPQYGIGYADFADPGNPAGLSSGQIEIKYTLLGDANLDGAVNGSDFAILASNFNKAVSSWDQGDFNYDGAANGTDFAALAVNFNKGASLASTDALDTFAAANGLMADVPEPATGSLILLAGLGSLARRKRPRSNDR